MLHSVHCDVSHMNETDRQTDRQIDRQTHLVWQTGQQQSCRMTLVSLIHPQDTLTDPRNTDTDTRRIHNTECLNLAVDAWCVSEQQTRKQLLHMQGNVSMVCCKCTVMYWCLHVLIWVIIGWWILVQMWNYNIWGWVTITMRLQHWRTMWQFNFMTSQHYLLAVLLTILQSLQSPHTSVKTLLD